MSKDTRKNEIITACKKLYKTMGFKDITIKEISNETTFSRPSIYNYFQTKEEIFLAFLEKEYSLWIEDLEKIYNENSILTVNEFADNISKTLEKRTEMLKLLSMNMYDIETNSRFELLVDFKKEFVGAMKELDKLLTKFFINIKQDEKEDFIYMFSTFVYGIYPYTVIDDRQRNAMKEAGYPYKYMDIYNLCYKMIIKLLK